MTLTGLVFSCFRWRCFW